MPEIAALLLLFLGVLFWTSAMRAREAALRVASQTCKRHELQLLDATVALTAIRPARNHNGRATWRRRYGFEFTAGTDARLHGEIELLGHRLAGVRLELPDHTLIDS